VCSNSPDAASVLDVLERERPTLVNGFAQSVAHLARDPSFARRDLSSIRRGNLYPILPEGVRPKDPGLRHGMLGMTETGSVCLVSADEAELPSTSEAPSAGLHRASRPGSSIPIRIGPARSATPGSCGSGCLPHGGILRARAVRGLPTRRMVPDGGPLSRRRRRALLLSRRRGDVIKTAGANVSPREVEAVFAEAAGLRAHVVGLDDAERGQRVAAAIVSEGPIDLDALKRVLGERLSSYKVRGPSWCSPRLTCRRCPVASSICGL